MAAPIQSPIILNVGQSSPTSLPPEIRAAVDPIYNALQQLLAAFNRYAGVAPWPTSQWSQLTPDITLQLQNMQRIYVPFTQNAVAGHLVNLHNNAGVLSAQLANATDNTKPASGWSTGAVAAGDVGEVMFGNGLCTSIGGLTIAQQYWLSTTDGLVANTPPVAPGNIQQSIGFALAATQMWMHITY